MAKKKPLTRAQWLADVEKASGMSWIQFKGLGLEIQEGFCRRPACRGFHFVAPPPEPGPTADDLAEAAAFRERA